MEQAGSNARSPRGRPQLQATQLDIAGVVGIALIREHVADHGDKTVYFSIRVPEVVPGGKPVERIFLITDKALYKIPQTAVETGIFFDARFPLSNLTQVLVIDGGDAAPPVVQFNGFKMKQSEQTLFALRFADERRRAEALLTLCHLFPDLPILKKKKIEGKFYDVPYIDSSLAVAPPGGADAASPPLTNHEARKRLRWSTDALSPPGAERHQPEVTYLLDAAAAPQQRPREGSCGGAGSEGPPPPDAGAHRGRSSLRPSGLKECACAPPPPAGPLSPGHVDPMPRDPRRPRIPAMSRDPQFEAQRRRLRDLLFDHDLTNLQLRASLSLLEDERPAAGAAEPVSVAVRRRDGDTQSAAGSEFSFQSEEDPELQRRIEQQQLQEELRREREALQREQIRGMLSGLECRIERQIQRETQRQMDTARRVSARQPAGDRKVRQLGQQLQLLRERHQRQERAAAARREREVEEIAERIDAARWRAAEQRLQHGLSPRRGARGPPPGGAFGRSPGSAGGSGERESLQQGVYDEDICGPEVFGEYTRWRQTGGLLHGDGSWQRADSLRLAQMLRAVAADLRACAADEREIARAGQMLGNVTRELTMLGSRSPARPPRQQPRPATVPEPFELSRSNRRRFQGLTQLEMEQGLRDHRLLCRQRLHQLQEDLIAAQATKEAAPPLSPRELAQRGDPGSASPRRSRS
eukprot:TRINITY_DN1924_c0_g1_i1.p1 TRINITY_DN1924_c0_g1~~TRINITY_DN1924_c0_g1_i1.p1  ORF type:complete len:696 (+),score=274.58 TRINITY_DN1924_c0_g1_i1:100-2187(+)